MQEFTWRWKRGDTPDDVVKVAATHEGEAIDLTSWTVRAQVRRTVAKDSALLAELPVDRTEQTDGIVYVRPTPSDTEAVFAVTSEAQFDVELDNGLDDPDHIVKTPVGGPVLIDGDVSRAET